MSASSLFNAATNHQSHSLGGGGVQIRETAPGPALWGAPWTVPYRPCGQSHWHMLRAAPLCVAAVQCRLCALAACHPPPVIWPFAPLPAQALHTPRVALPITAVSEHLSYKTASMKLGSDPNQPCRCLCLDVTMPQL